MITQPHQKPFNWHLIGVAAGLVPFFILLYLTHFYFRRYSLVSDEWLLGAHTSADVMAGLFGPADLFQKYGVQRPLYAVVVDVLFTWLTDWDIALMVYLLPFMALGWWALLMLLVWGWNPDWVGLFAVVSGIAVFSLGHEDLWVLTTSVGWHMAWISFLLGLGVIQLNTGGENWGTLSLLALLAVGSCFGSITGFTTWLIFPLVLAFHGWRSIWMLAVWTLLLTLFAAFYVSPLFAGENLAAQAFPQFYLTTPLLGLETLPRVVFFTCVIIGRALLLGPYGTISPSLAAIGLVGTALFCFLLWQTLSRGWLKGSQLALPLALAAYGIGGALIVSLGRAVAEQNSVARFANLGITVWFGVILLGIVILDRSLKIKRRDNLHYIALLSVSGSGMAILAAYGWLTVFFLLNYPQSPWQIKDRCERALPLVEIADCADFLQIPLDELNPNGLTPGAWMQYEYLYRLAAYRLGIYRQVEPRLILPDYQPGDVVLIISPNIWANLTFREWLLAGVPESDILHAAAPGTWTSGDTFDPPPDDVWQAITAQNVREISARLGERAWIIAATRSQQQTDLLLQAVEQGGGQVMPLPVEQHAVYALYRINQ